MDLDRKYKNITLEKKRIEALRLRYAESLLQKKKQKSNGIASERKAAYKKYEAGLTPPEKIFEKAFPDEAGYASKDYALKTLMFIVYEQTSLFENMNEYATPLERLAENVASWVREPRDWVSKTHNTERQFSSLAHWLLCKYKIPTFMDYAWKEDGLWSKIYQQWFIHLGAGNNIRTAENLPIKLTKKQAHYFSHAPSNSTIPQALRYGQVLGLGGSPRLAAVISDTRLRNFDRAIFSNVDVEAFWESVIIWFIAQGMFDYNQIGPIIDYIYHERFERQPGRGVLQPNFTMRGRTMDSMIKYMESWHRALRKIKSGKDLIWGSCSINGFSREEGADETKKRTFEIKEILSSHELRAEGNAMHHCVYSYATSCFNRKTAIFSLTQNNVKKVTIEVNLTTKMIVQVRGKLNKRADSVDERILRAWAGQEGLKFSSHCL